MSFSPTSASPPQSRATARRVCGGLRRSSERPRGGSSDRRGRCSRRTRCRAEQPLGEGRRGRADSSRGRRRAVPRPIPGNGGRAGRGEGVAPRRSRSAGQRRGPRRGTRPRRRPGGGRRARARDGPRTREVRVRVAVRVREGARVAVRVRVAVVAATPSASASAPGNVYGSACAWRCWCASRSRRRRWAVGVGVLERVGRGRRGAGTRRPCASSSPFASPTAALSASPPGRGVRRKRDGRRHTRSCFMR